jgi:hypothetical protein
VEVAKEKSRNGYLKFHDNCVILSIKESSIEVDEIIENL